MSWILLAAIGQFINAIVALLDKYIVSDKNILPKPFVYSFYSCLLTGGWILIFAFGLIPALQKVGVPSLLEVKTPTLTVVALSFLAAYTFFIALVSMFNALKYSNPAEAMPVIGAISALSTFGLSYLFLNTNLSTTSIFGILFLISGTFLVTKSLPKKSIILYVIHSGLFFAMHYITMKGLFLETGFANGFFWSRIGFILFSLSLLLVPVYFNKIKSQTETATKRTGIIIFVNKILAGVATFVLLKATDMGEVSVVQALDGLRYIFITVIMITFYKYLPNTVINKAPKNKQIFRQITYITLISVGFLFLFK